MREHRDYCLHIHDNSRIIKDLKGSEMTTEEHILIEKIVVFSRAVVPDASSSILDTCVYLTVIADGGIQISIPQMKISDATLMMQELVCEFPKADFRINTPEPLKFTATIQ